MTTLDAAVLSVSKERVM